MKREYATKAEVVTALTNVSTLPPYGQKRGRVIYETGKGFWLKPSGRFNIDFASDEGGTSKEVPLSVIEELEREGFIKSAFPDYPGIKAWRAA